MNESKVGIFWIADCQIISFSVPLSRSEQIGGFANYAHGHAQMWLLVLRSHPRLQCLAYDEVPRGRVLYDTAHRRFHLLLPPTAVADRELIERLIGEFALPAAQTLVLADQHYDRPETGRDTQD